MSVSKLREEAETIIAPWRYRAAKPPFKLNELIVLALVIADGPLTKRETQIWIMKNFGYYEDLGFWLATDSAVVQIGPDRDAQLKYSEAVEFKRMLHLKFDDYWMPIFRENEADDIWAKRRIDLGTVGDFFDDHFRAVKKDTSPFPFMHLPAELRVRIYKYVLVFPKVGITFEVERIESDVRRKTVVVHSKDWNASTFSNVVIYKHNDDSRSPLFIKG